VIVPKALNRLFIDKGGETHIVPPSAQSWNKMNPEARKDWRAFIEQIGVEPEDVLDIMRANKPRGKK